MGCGQKAIAEDEDEWDDFKQKAGVLNTTWKVYSREAHLAKVGYKDHRFSASVLEKFVAISVELDNAKTIYSSKLDKLHQFNSL
jgi:hypothetical protein